MGEEVKLSSEVERDDLGLLVVNLHFVFLCESAKIFELMLENRQVRREGKARDLMEVGGANNVLSWDKEGLYWYSFK